jgi:putative spermidine/putrescine transport system ATP-binding protein
MTIMLMKARTNEEHSAISAAEEQAGASYLQVKAVTKSYDGHSMVLNGIDLDVRKGEFITFLGPSGSGKTTMLSMIAGFEAPTTGDISVNGRSLVNIPANKRNIGLVFQNYALFPHMTTLENVMFPLKMRKVNKAEAAARARRALGIVGLEKHVDRYPKQLSGGQQQRVALARALVFEPDVLLLDEPLSALDKHLREQMQVEIKRIHRELKMTTIFVTHDQSEAMTMSDRIAVFNNGRIEQFAAPLDLYAAPATHFVGSFIGDSNFLDVSVEDPHAGIYRSATMGDVQGPVTSHAKGTPLLLMLRPETIRLVARSESDAQRTMLITGVVNYGDSVLAMGTVGSTELRVRVPRIDAQGVQEGAVFGIRWNAQDSHVVLRDKT